MPGLPTATLPLMRVLVARAAIRIPFALPIAVFSSTVLLSPLRMPMPKSSLGVEKPFPLVSFHRSELLDPSIHIPPQAAPAAVAPFLTEMLEAIVTRDEVAVTRMPD